MDNQILEELYEIRARIWKECGGTTEGLVKYLRTNPIEGFPRSDLKPVAPRPSRLRPDPMAAHNCSECGEDEPQPLTSSVAESPPPPYQA